MRSVFLEVPLEELRKKKTYFIFRRFNRSQGVTNINGNKRTKVFVKFFGTVKKDGEVYSVGNIPLKDILKNTQYATEEELIEDFKKRYRVSTISGAKVYSVELISD